MCGISGFDGDDGNLLSRMLRSLAHRGPDHTGTYRDGKFSLGYRRLGIVDRERGNQPISNEDGSLILFFNGEIYNFKELRHGLEPKHSFSTASDSEVILHAYEEYGPDALNRFDGMFAFVIYDTKKGELFLARDRLGIKPLYYFFDGSKFMFSSELKAILQDETVEREIDVESLISYFCMRFCPGERSILKGIRRLLPGHYLLYDGHTLKTRQYWDIAFNPAEGDESLQIETFRRIFEDSVRRRMSGNISPGILLSGGIDSSSIVAFASRFSNDELKTYTLGFESDRDSFSDARIIAEEFGTDHKEFVLGPESVNLLPKLVWHLDEPLANPSAIPHYMLAQNSDSKTLLCGEVADELFGGYEHYKIMGLRRPYGKLPALARRILASPLLALKGDAFFSKLHRFMVAGEKEAHLELLSVFGKSERSMLLSSSYDSGGVPFDHGPRPQGYLNRMLYHDLKTRLPDDILTRFDRMTMANSVEGRVPFGSHQIVEFSSRLPPGLKLRATQDKYILRKAMRNLLPERIVKLKKRRFSVPTDRWFKTAFGDFSVSVLDENMEIVDQFFNQNYIEKLQSESFPSQSLLKFHRLTSLYYSRQMWSIVTFILWYDIFINKSRKYLKGNVI